MGRALRPRPKYLAKKLKQIRIALNLSQTEMLIKLGYPADKKEFSSVVSAYELNKREPTLIDLLNYAKIYQIAVESLIDDEKEIPAKLS